MDVVRERRDGVRLGASCQQFGFGGANATLVFESLRD